MKLDISVSAQNNYIQNVFVIKGKGVDRTFHWGRKAGNVREGIISQYSMNSKYTRIF